MYHIKPVKNLLEDYKASGEHPILIERQKFHLEGDLKGRDCYNPAYPIRINGNMIVPVRVESRYSEKDSKVVVFWWKSFKWRPYTICEGYAQDPCLITTPLWARRPCLMQGSAVIGLHRDDPFIGLYKPDRDVTVFFNLITGLKMAEYQGKDVRVCGDIVFTRPDGNILMQVHDQRFSYGFSREEWGGVNHVQLLPSGYIGILGHVGCYDNDKGKHYYPVAFTVDPIDGRVVQPPKILCTREDLPPGPAKRPDLKDVIFPGGMFLKGKRAALWLGVSDCETYSCEIKNPFQEGVHA